MAQGPSEPTSTPPPPLAPSYRAYGAFSLEEEKHAIQMGAHHALTIRHRAQHLRSQGGSPDELEKNLRIYDEVREELRRSILTEASHEALEDQDVLKAVLSVPEFIKDVAVVGLALELWPGAWKHIDKDLLEDEHVMRRVIKKHGWWLRYASPQLRADKELALQAVASDAWALEFVSDDLKVDREVVLRAVSNHPASSEVGYGNHGVLSLADPMIRGDKEIALAAVESDAWDLQYVPGGLQQDRDLVLAALRRQSRQDVAFFGRNMLQHLPDWVRADEGLVLEAVRASAGALGFASRELRQDKDFVLRAARVAPDRQHEECFLKSELSIDYFHFVGALISLMAVEGENAPVLTITLPPEDVNCEPHGFQSCNVTLLSGLSFRCDLTPWREWSLSAIGFGFILANLHPRAEHEQQQQHEGVAGETSQLPDYLDVATMTAMVLRELRNHVEVPERARAWIVFSKPGPDGDEASRVTPWDWHRPLSDFL